MESSRSKLLISQENTLDEEFSVCGAYCVLGEMGGYVIHSSPLLSESGQIGGREINPKAYQAKGHRMADGLGRGGGECCGYAPVPLSLKEPCLCLRRGVPASCLQKLAVRNTVRNIDPRTVTQCVASQAEGGPGQTQEWAYRP